MSEQLLIKGFIIGFSIAAPVGPIGVLCIRRTLVNGRLAGLLSGLGAATADAVYGVIAGFGLTVIAGFLLRQQTWLSLGGGLFLCVLGLKTILKKPEERLISIEGRPGLGGAYASTFLLTLTNPATILAFMAIFAGLGVANSSRNHASAALVVLGVFIGSALWWLILSGSVSLLRSRLTPSRLRWANRLSGLVITTFGLFILLSVARTIG
jgi:threonine/homoserine/homoserine lactone efflux protein